MAMAVSTPREVETREVVLEAGKVVLTLSHEEAATLHDVMRAIGGCPQKSRRQYTEAIVNALRSAHVPYAKFPVADMSREHRFIYFNDKE